MGNVHSVLQIAPIVSIEGAAIRVRPGMDYELRGRKRPSYVVLERFVPRLTIYNVNVSPNHVRDDDRAITYVVINGRGKWGYSFDFEKYLEEAAPCLEDATFFIGDEEVQFVREYVIERGEFRVEYHPNGPLDDHVETRVRNDASKYYAFAMQLAHRWLDVYDEPDGALPWVDKAIAKRSHAWEAHFLRARVLGMQAGHAAAIESPRESARVLGSLRDEAHERLRHDRVGE